MKKCWQVEFKGDDEYCTAIVAESRAEAKKLFWKEAEDLFYYTWIDIRARQIKADVQDLPIGVVDEIEGLKRGIYGDAEYTICPTCGKTDITIWYNGDKIVCSECCEEEK